MDSEVSPPPKTKPYIYPSHKDTKLRFNDLNKALPFNANYKLDPRIGEVSKDIGRLLGGIKKEDEQTAYLNILYNLYLIREISKIRGEPIYTWLSLRSNFYSGLTKWYKKHFSYIFVTRQLKRFEETDWLIKQLGFLNRAVNYGRTTRLAPAPKLEEIFEDCGPYIKTVRIPYISPVLLKDKYKRFCAPPDDENYKELCENVHKVNADNRAHRIQIPSDTVRFKFFEIFAKKLIAREQPIIPNSSTIADITALPDPSFPLSPLTDRFFKEIASGYSLLLSLSDPNRVNDGLIDVTDEVLYTRIFNNGVLNEGGRFYCPLQNLPGVIRSEILIDGEPVVELDFSGLHIRMLYNKNGLPLTDDPYLLPGYERRRDDVKTANLIAINASNRYKAAGAIKNEGILDAEELLRIFGKSHPKISDYFFSGEGVRLQYQDSRIAERVMLTFSEIGETCICVHDSFIVKASLEDFLRAVMEVEYKRELFFEPSIEKKSADRKGR
jgi:hypothetical protein